MGIATELLALRHHQFSSVATLIAALERVREGPPEKQAQRKFIAGEAADIVLANVAAHAAEILSEQQVPAFRRTLRRVAQSLRRKNRRFDSGLAPHQRRLFV